MIPMYLPSTVYMSYPIPFFRPHHMAGIANVQDIFLIFGDSITEVSFEPEHRGFGQRLARTYLLSLIINIPACCGYQTLSTNHITADVYARRLDIVNRGLSGYNTDWGLRVLKQASCFLKCSIPLPSQFFLTLEHCHFSQSV